MIARALVLFATLAAASLGVVLLLPSAERADFTRVLSTRRTDALGAKALYEVLARTGSDVARAQSVLAQPQPGGTLLLLEPDEPRAPLAGLKPPPVFTPEEVRGLRAFVEAGGRIVLASRSPTPLHREFGLSPRARDAKRKPREDVTLVATPSAASVTRATHLLAHAGRPLELSPSDPRALFVHEDGVAVARVTQGRGDVIFIGAPSLASNAYLAAADNLEWMLDLAGRGPIRFDESKHGEVRSDGLAGLVRRFDAGFATFQLALAALLLLWSDARRRRAAVKAPATLGAREQVEAIASLYERGRVGADAAETLTLGLLRAGVSRFGAREVRDLAGLATHLSTAGHDVLAGRTRAVERLGAALGERPKAKALLAFARACAQLRAEYADGPAGTTHPSDPHALAVAGAHEQRSPR